MSTTSKSVSDSSKLSRLERAADGVEIREIYARYCRGIDRGDFDLVLSCFHEDGTEDHSGFNGKARNFYPIIKPKYASHVTCFHITNVSVEFAAEDTALAEAYHLAILRAGADPIDTFMSGRYLDRFERRNGQWRIGHRVVIADWWSLVPRNHLSYPDGMEAKLTRGKRGLDDPYYSVRAAIFDR